MTAEQSIRNIEHLMDAVNAAARNTPKPDPRADLVDLFEARAETHDDKSWIGVEEAVDLVMDREAEITDAQVEAAARAIHDVDKSKAQSEYGVTLKGWERLDDEAVEAFFEYARAALEAVREARI